MGGWQSDLCPGLLLHCSHGFLQEVPDLRERELGLYLFSSSVFWLGTFCPGLWEGQDCLHLERRGRACVITWGRSPWGWGPLSEPECVLEAVIGIEGRGQRGPGFQLPISCGRLRPGSSQPLFTDLWNIAWPGGLSDPTLLSDCASVSLLCVL